MFRSVVFDRRCSAVGLRARLLCAGLAALFAPHALASSDDPGVVIAGYVEKITLLENGQVLKAKLDSGARTSSIHAVDVEIFERDDDEWVRFTLITDNEDDAPRLKLERKRVRRVLIKDPDEDDDGDSRPVVELDICFNGRPYQAQFTLNDRTGMLYTVLLGRMFLSNKALINPAATFETLAHCDNGQAR